MHGVLGKSVSGKRFCPFHDHGYQTGESDRNGGCPSYKYTADGHCMGILRLDLLPEYETGKDIQELLEIILDHVYKDFQVHSVFMKVQEDVDPEKCTENPAFCSSPG